MGRLASCLMICFSMALVLTSCGGGGGGESTPPPKPAITAMNGGLAGSGPVNSIFVIDGTGFGALGAATTGYSVDFKDASGNIVLANDINYAAGGWTDAFIKGTVPNLTPGTTYKVTVTTAGGTSNTVDFLVVASFAYSPSAILWSSASSTLPVAMQGFPSIVSTLVSTTTTTSYIYVLGGNIASSATATSKAANTEAVYMSRLDNATGGLATAWTATTPLPAKLGFSAAVYANKFNSFVGGNGHVYILGGLDSQGTATAAVYHAAVNDDGGLGAWAATTPLPQAIFAHGAVIFRDRIYIAGGNDANGPVKTVWSAKIKSDGALESWSQLTDLPDVRAYHQLVTVAGYLYVIGGTNANIDPITNNPSSGTVDTVYYNQINLSDGSLVGAAWTQNGSGPKAREKFTATVAGSNIVVSGGLYNGALNGSNEQQAAEINSDGSTKPFGGATGVHTISGSVGGYNFFNNSNAFFVDSSGKPHVIILGGGDVGSGSPHDGVWICSQQ